PANLDRTALLNFREGGTDLLELGAQPVALGGGGAELGQPLERGAELLPERLALGRHLGDFDRPALLLLDERGLKVIKLAAKPVALVAGRAQLGQPLERRAQLL